MSLRPKIVKLARMIGGVPGMLNKIDEDAPEYYALECVVTDEMADIALCAGLRKPRTMQYLADKSGKSLEETTRLAHELANTGVFTVWTDRDDGLERCYVEIFAPGTLERMVGNREQLARYPQIGKAFNAYTSKLGASLASTLPMGSSLMRVIPIESSIDGDPQAVDFEKISYYLDKYDVFSVSDCSCRASRRIMGEGCGHLEKDMCLHLGPAAEFYAETGKARYVTKEEAREIIKRAEENGLMHSMPNIHEPGDSDSICNCCACSCFGLRIGLMYGARDAIRSNYVAKIDEEKCVACGQCVEYCTGNALKLGQKLCTKEPLKAEPSYKKINTSRWTRADWNVDYHENKVDTVETGTAPCKTACPAHIAVQGYLRLAAQGRYRDALALIKKENPFPAVCGRICNHVCETECTRGSIDEAVAIDEVKRFIADQDLNAETRYIPPMVNQTGEPYPEKIAIIGAGPAGMSCAFYLAQKGYRPVVFDKAGRPGGMLMNGIPSFRLEKDVVEAEGITVENGWGPKEILAENGRVKAVVFKKCVSVFDENHRFHPVYDEAETVTVECENVLLSIGQSIEWGELLAGTKAVCNRNGTVKADPLTCQTAEPDIFAGGDVVTGPKFAIDAIAAGKEAAISLHRYVHEGQSLTLGRDRRIYHALDKGNALIEAGSFDTTPPPEAGLQRGQGPQLWRHAGDLYRGADPQGDRTLPGLRGDQGGRVPLHRLRPVHHQVRV